MPATTEPTTDEPQTIGSDTDTDTAEPTTEGDTAEPLDLVGGLLAA